MHQANRNLIVRVAKALGVGAEKFYCNIERYGNTSSASMLIAALGVVTGGGIPGRQAGGLRRVWGGLPLGRRHRRGPLTGLGRALQFRDVTKHTRRSLFRSLSALPALALRGQEKPCPPIRALTKGPKFHWFGYYRQARVRSLRPLCAVHGERLRESQTCGGRRDPGGDDRPRRRRPVDRTRDQPRLVLAARLHAAMVARVEDGSHLERSRRRPLRLPTYSTSRRASAAPCRARSTPSVRTVSGR